MLQLLAPRCHQVCLRLLVVSLLTGILVLTARFMMLGVAGDFSQPLMCSRARVCSCVLLDVQAYLKDHNFSTAGACAACSVLQGLCWLD